MLTKEFISSGRIEPRFIEPMYVRPVRELPDSGLWTYEAKLDGYRCLAAKRSGGVVLWSRRGNGFTDRFPEIARACDNLPPDTLIDGEVSQLTPMVASRSTACSTVARGRTYSFMHLTCWFTGDATCSTCRWRPAASCLPTRWLRSTIRCSVPQPSMPSQPT